MVYMKSVLAVDLAGHARPARSLGRVGGCITPTSATRLGSLTPCL
jgi:hypothetical protein